MQQRHQDNYSFQAYDFLYFPVTRSLQSSLLQCRFFSSWQVPLVPAYPQCSHYTSWQVPLVPAYPQRSHKMCITIKHWWNATWSNTESDSPARCHMSEQVTMTTLIKTPLGFTMTTLVVVTMTTLLVSSSHHDNTTSSHHDNTTSSHHDNTSSTTRDSCQPCPTSTMQQLSLYITQWKQQRKLFLYYIWIPRVCTETPWDMEAHTPDKCRVLPTVGTHSGPVPPPGWSYI